MCLEEKHIVKESLSLTKLLESDTGVLSGRPGTSKSFSALFLAFGTGS